MTHPIRNILVAVKHPGADTMPAVTQAARIARACGAHLEFFHAIEAAVYADSPAAYEAAAREAHESRRRQYRQRLERIAARVRLHGVEVSTAVEFDCPASDAIIRRAALIQADLIVARRNCNTPGNLRLMRLTDWELLRHSPAPVLLVQGSRPYHHPAVLAAVDPCHAHAKPAQLDEAILSVASQLTQALSGKLHVVHAYERIVMGSATNEPAKQLEHVLESYDIPMEHLHLIGKEPAAAINEIAQRTRARIVVMGALSRSGLKGFLVGNTAERVLNDLPCDVLIVKPVQFTSRIPSRCRGLQLLSRHS